MDFGDDRVCFCGYKDCDLCWPDGICRTGRSNWGRDCPGCERCQSVNWLRRRVAVRAIGGAIKLLQHIREDDETANDAVNATGYLSAAAIVDYPLLEGETNGDLTSAVERLYESYKRETLKLKTECRHKYWPAREERFFELQRTCIVCQSALSATFRYSYHNRVSGWTAQADVPISLSPVVPDRPESPPPVEPQIIVGPVPWGGWGP